MIENQFMNRSSFTKLVETSVFQMKLSYIEAVVHVCESQSIDPEDVKKFISPVVKDKIEAEAISLNCLPRQNTLIFD
tara:strand:- start:141 stop:371 length:231 start_codon:yes stop_codon:yes gene_type:complete